MADDKVDKIEETLEEVEEVLEEGPLRILGYFARIGRLVGTAFGKGSRYVAYSSDVGESLRPVADQRIVRAGYVVAGAYIIADVSVKGMEAVEMKEPVLRTVCHQTVFQSLASLLLPAVIIHQAMIPFLPILDPPVEWLVDEGFEKFWPVEEHGNKSKAE